MPAALKTRAEASAELLDLFRRRGYDGASLTDITAAVGLGKGSLYHYFPGGKAEMAEAVLDAVDSWMASAIAAPLDEPRPPPARLAALLRTLSAFYQGGAQACILERLVASVERDRFRRPLGRAFEAFIAAFQRLAVEAGVPARAARHRAEDAVAAIEGALVLCAGLGQTAPFARALRNIEATLLAAG